MRGWRPWTVQPPPGTPIDWDNPLTVGLVAIYSASLRNSVTNASLTNSGVSLGVNFSGIGISGYTATAFLQDNSLPYFTPPLSAYALVSSLAAIGSAGSQAIFSFGGATSGDGWKFGGGNSGGYTLDQLVFTYGGVADYGFSGSFFSDLGAPIAVGLSISASTVVAYKNGATWGSKVLGTPKATSQPARLGVLNNGSSTGSPWTGTIFQAYIWKEVLSASQQNLISLNPWQIFHRRRRAYSLITSSTISASISEAVTSSDAYALSATAAAAITAAATSSDAYALAATVPSAISEEIYPSDAYALAVTIAAALDSSAAASSALSAVATIAATIADVSSAQDTLGVTATVLAAIAEAATATDTQVTRSVTSAEYAESATAAAIFSATVSIAATLTEAGLAADQIAAMATVAADLAESGAASDAYLSSVLLAVELLENAAAADELSAAAFEQIIDAAKTIITILQAQDTVTMVQARDTLRILQ